MSQKQNLRDQYRKLYEAREWLAEKLCEEDDRMVRHALFEAKNARSIKLKDISY
jgi:hypothetical protein